MNVDINVGDEQPSPTQHETQVVAWFNKYCDQRTGEPAVRARLRRCRNSIDALMIPAAIELARRMGTLKTSPSLRNNPRFDAAIDLARVLAHVKRHNGAQPLMRAAGWKTFVGDRKESDAGEDRPVISEIRFCRLLSAYESEELVTSFVRLVRLLDGEVNVDALASDFQASRDDDKRSRLKKKWTLDYYAAGVPTTAEDSSSINQLENSL